MYVVSDGHTQIYSFIQSCRANQSTHFVFHNFVRKSCNLWYNTENVCRAEKATDDNGPGTHCIGGLVGLRGGLDGWGKISRPTGFDPRTIQPAAIHYTDWATPARQRSTEASVWFHKQRGMKLPHLYLWNCRPSGLFSTFRRNLMPSHSWVMRMDIKHSSVKSVCILRPFIGNQETSGIN
jgi:hypothetical protein